MVRKCLFGHKMTQESLKNQNFKKMAYIPYFCHRITVPRQFSELNVEPELRLSLTG